MGPLSTVRDTRAPKVLQSVDGALTVLEVLAGAGPGMTLAEIAAVARRPKASVYRVLQTLITRGYARAVGGGVYVPGPRIMALAGRVRADLDLVRVARPLLVRLESVTTETIHLGLFTGREAIYVEKIDAREFFAVQSYVGMTMRLHSTAIGKCILAFLPLADRRALLAVDELERSTPRTLTSADAIETELVRVSANGYAIDDEENHAGIRCVAAPVFGEDGAVIGAVSVTAPAFRFSMDDAVALAPSVQEVARDISATLGWSGTPPTRDDLDPLRPDLPESRAR